MNFLIGVFHEETTFDAIFKLFLCLKIETFPLYCSKFFPSTDFSQRIILNAFLKISLKLSAYLEHL